jgi:hypothetical protein
MNDLEFKKQFLQSPETQKERIVNIKKILEKYSGRDVNSDHLKEAVSIIEELQKENEKLAEKAWKYDDLCK